MLQFYLSAPAGHRAANLRQKEKECQLLSLHLTYLAGLSTSPDYLPRRIIHLTGLSISFKAYMFSLTLVTGSTLMAVLSTQAMQSTTKPSLTEHVTQTQDVVYIMQIQSWTVSPASMMALTMTVMIIFQMICMNQLRIRNSFLCVTLNQCAFQQLHWKDSIFSWKRPKAGSFSKTVHLGRYKI